jgi:hypothetical protein
MATLQLALQLPQDIDLRGFSLLLHTQNIVHRITLEGVYQVVWIGSDEDPAAVVTLYQTWLAQAPVEGAAGPGLMGRLIKNALAFPLTVLIIVLNCGLVWVGLKASEGDFSGLIQQLTMTPMTLTGGYLVFEPLTATFAQQAYWRLVTPMLLHFSWLHLAFNLLWVWELGRRIEKLHGISLFLAVTLLGLLRRQPHAVHVIRAFPVWRYVRGRLCVFRILHGLGSNAASQPDWPCPGCLLGDVGFLSFGIYRCARLTRIGRAGQWRALGRSACGCGYRFNGPGRRFKAER